jgi:hypothetical protein
MIGKCHICGNTTKLSFEHVPPRSAFNDRQVVYYLFEDVFNKPLDNLTNGKISQKGMGGYTLCIKCNNDTGGWYGGAFSDFVFQGMRILQYTSSCPSLYYNFFIYPQRVLKQILCMFFSSCHAELQEAHPGLIRYILNKDETYYASDVRVFVYYNLSNRFRKTGLMVSANLAGKMDVISEITFPPFGYVMSFNNTVPDKRLTEITFFKNYSYNQWIDVPLKLNLLPVYTYFPCDYRSKTEVEEEIKKNSLTSNSKRPHL